MKPQLDRPVVPGDDRQRGQSQGPVREAGPACEMDGAGAFRDVEQACEDVAAPAKNTADIRGPEAAASQFSQILAGSPEHEVVARGYAAERVGTGPDGHGFQRLHGVFVTKP